MKLKRTAVIYLLVVALCTACDTRSTGDVGRSKPAVNVDPTAPESTPASRPEARPTPHVICGLYRDISPSVDAATEQIVGAALDESLDAFIDHNRCSEIRYGAFASEGAFFVPQRVLLPDSAAETGDCEQQLSAEDRALIFLPGATAAAKKRCRDEADEERKRVSKERSEALKVVRDFLTGNPTRHGSCTSLAGLLQMLDRSRGIHDIDIIVSDGAETCASEMPPFTIHHRVVLVQCPRSGNLSVTGPEALARAQSLEERVTNLQVVLPAEITSRFWSDDDAAAPDGKSLRADKSSASEPLIVLRR